MIEEKKYLRKTTAQFWNENSKELKNLRRLAMKLLNIPSSSAYIERHFSLCGAICDQRNRNMSADMIATRTMLKANIKSLMEMNRA
jgi:hypothetical protein